MFLEERAGDSSVSYKGMCNTHIVVYYVKYGSECIDLRLCNGCIKNRSLYLRLCDV